MDYTEDRESIQNSNSDLKFLLLRYLRWWPLYIICIIISLSIAWVKLRFTVPEYLTKASLYVKLQTAKKGEIMAINDFQNMTLPTGLVANEVDNELSVLKSKPLLYNVVKKIGLDVKAIKKGRFKDTELYEDAPFYGSILVINQPRKFKSKEYEIIPQSNNGYKLLDEKKEIIGRFSIPLKTDWGTIVLNRNSKVYFEKPIFLLVTNPKILVDQLEASITLNIPEKKSSIIEISRVGTNPVRSEDIVNELMNQYNSDAIKDKNIEALATANFIDERLKVITEELGGIENKKENFKESNKIADLQSQAELSLKNVSESTKKLLDLSTQLEMVNSVLAITNSSSNEQLLPTNLGMPSALDALIGDYNQLVLTKNRTLRQATPSNPSVIQMNRDIASMKELIRENLKKSQANIQLTMGQTKNQMDQSGEAISKFPLQEKFFRSIERQQNLKESLYLYLLQKREETSIGLSANAPKAKIVNPAYTSDSPVSPKRNTYYLIAFSLGFLIPTGLLYIIFALDTKIHNRREIRKELPEIPVVGEIPNAGDEENSVVKENDLTAFAESFRIMLTNAKFIIKPIKGIAPVIMVSASVKGEGKTTVSTNTALILAQNRKVLLLGADLRNPQLKRFITHGKKGLSDYLVNENENNLEQYIETFKGNPNLDVLSSGTVPPNPTYLLSSDKMVNVFTELKSKYDYIIVDTAPLLLVSDSFHLIKYTDLLLYVMRADFTDVDMLEVASEINRENANNKLAIVLNDVKDRNISHYDKKYGHGYYSDDYKSKKVNKIFKWISKFTK